MLQEFLRFLRSIQTLTLKEILTLLFLRNILFKDLTFLIHPLKNLMLLVRKGILQPESDSALQYNKPIISFFSFTNIFENI